jgi:hypothetical protein
VKGVLYAAALRAVDGDQTALAVLSDVQSGDPIKQMAAILLACLQGQPVPSLGVLWEPDVAALCLTWACYTNPSDRRRVLRGLCETVESAPYPIGSRP